LIHKRTVVRCTRYAPCVQSYTRTGARCVTSVVTHWQRMRVMSVLVWMVITIQTGMHNSRRYIMAVELNKLYDALIVSYTPQEIKEIWITLKRAESKHKEA